MSAQWLWHTVDDTLARDLAYSSIQFTVLLRLNAKLSKRIAQERVCYGTTRQRGKEQTTTTNAITATMTTIII